MRLRLSTDVRNLFSETWVSVGEHPSGNLIEKRRRPCSYGVAYAVGWVYAWVISRRVARDVDFVSGVKKYVELAGRVISEDELLSARRSMRFCSTQSIGKLIFLFPRDFAAGVRDSMSVNIARFFPKKGERPVDSLGFNYFVTEVVFEYFENYGGIYYRKNGSVDVVFDVDIDS